MPFSYAPRLSDSQISALLLICRSLKELLEKFKQAQREVRPAVEAMLAEADRVAESKSGGYSLEDIFGTEDEE